MGYLKRADQSFRRSSGQYYRAINQNGFMVDLIHPIDDLLANTDDRVNEEDLVGTGIEGLEWLVNAPKLERCRHRRGWHSPSMLVRGSSCLCLTQGLGCGASRPGAGQAHSRPCTVAGSGTDSQTLPGYGNVGSGAFRTTLIYAPLCRRSGPRFLGGKSVKIAIPNPIRIDGRNRRLTKCHCSVTTPPQPTRPPLACSIRDYQSAPLLGDASWAPLFPPLPPGHWQ